MDYVIRSEQVSLTKIALHLQTIEQIPKNSWSGLQIMVSQWLPIDRTIGLLGEPRLDALGAKEVFTRKLYGFFQDHTANRALNRAEYNRLLIIKLGQI